MKRILIVYHSQQKGNTRRMAELVAQGCRETAGVEVAVVNVNEARVDMNAAERADAYAFGSPDYFTYMAGGLKQFFDDLCLADWAGKKVKGKPYVAFLTHGGGGGAIKSIEAMGASFKLQQVAPSVVCQGAPTGAAVEQSIALGRALAQRVVREAL
ncbi:MAG: NAD(P)H-dependent oxidoreductase [Planctomycetota bacterium]|nr:NAD(P)H-dependent oxidoreductase [Planctomycetota bacterium]